MYMDLSKEIKMDSSPTVMLDRLKYQKMMFIMNALDFDWTIKKSKDSYIFTKKHEGKKEVFHENYLESFIKTNMGDNLT